MDENRFHHAFGDRGDDLARWAADELAALSWTADGLYVATPDAGHSESVAFWRAALDTGLAFANPRLFPWTLANSPTGAIAQALGVRGPTYTLVGRGDAATAALDHAEDDIDDGIVRAAVVVAVAAGAAGRPALVATRLTARLPTPERTELLGTFAACLTSSSSRPMATSRPSP